MYALQQQILDTKEMRQRNRATPTAAGAVSVDSLWEQFRTVSGNVLPGLQGYDVSRPIAAGSYTQQGSSRNVYSRRR
ncbi:hypothetical protein STCU_02609 [Strigomonas culicis]|nr:hypothetical protein STCU_02609 [Strigomonas culicis]|eukprot:EPY32854.1 hypothetical protein STCU_02609 [Strigomonas culicis]